MKWQMCRLICYAAALISVSCSMKKEGSSSKEIIEVEKDFSESLAKQLTTTSELSGTIVKNAWSLVRSESPASRKDQSLLVFEDIGRMSGRVRSVLLELEQKLAKYPAAMPGSPFADIDVEAYNSLLLKVRSLIRTNSGDASTRPGSRGGNGNYDGIIGRMNIVAADVVDRIKEIELRDKESDEEDRKAGRSREGDVAFLKLRADRNAAELRTLMNNFVREVEAANTVIIDVVNVLTAWSQKAKLPNPPVDYWQACNMTSFADCRWGPSSAALASAVSNSGAAINGLPPQQQIVRPCAGDAQPFCEAEYANIRGNVEKWFQFNQITNLNDIMTKMKRSKLTVQIARDGAYSYVEAENLLIMPISASVGGEAEREKFFNAVGIKWSCPQTTSCGPCSDSGQRVCQITDCKNTVVQTYNESCTPQDRCAGFRGSSDCNRQSNCSWDYDHNECYASSGRECTFYSRRGSSACNRQDKCSWDYNNNECFISLNQPCTYYSRRGSSACNRQDNCSWDYNNNECFISTGQSCSYYSRHGSSACNRQQNCRWDYNNNRCL